MGRFVGTLVCTVIYQLVYMPYWARVLTFTATTMFLASLLTMLTGSSWGAPYESVACGFLWAVSAVANNQLQLATYCSAILYSMTHDPGNLGHYKALFLPQVVLAVLVWSAVVFLGATRRPRHGQLDVPSRPEPIGLVFLHCEKLFHRRCWLAYAAGGWPVVVALNDGYSFNVDELPNRSHVRLQFAVDEVGRSWLTGRPPTKGRRRQPTPECR
jgi:hypothetical protein